MLRAVAVVASLFIAIGGASAQQKEAAEQHTEKSNQNISPTITITNDDHSTHYCDKCRDRPTGFHKFITWPESIETWALILTLGAIVWQACLMRIHAKELRQLAKAAKENTEASIAAERAWLLIDILPVDPANLEKLHEKPDQWALLVTFRVKNSGRTAGRFISGSVRPHVVQSVSHEPILVVPALPAEPPYWPDSPIFETGKVWPPDKDFEFSSLIVKSEIIKAYDELMRREKAFCFYGILRYRDSFEITRETRFAYVYQFHRVGNIFLDEKTNEPLERAAFLPIKSEAYNRAT